MYPYLLLILPALLSCSHENPVPGKSHSPAPVTNLVTTLTEPAGAVVLPVGEELPVRLEFPDTLTLDSVQFFLGGDRVHTLKPGSAFLEAGVVEARLTTFNERTGNSGLRVRVYLGQGAYENHSRQVTFLSNLKPDSYGYSVVREYPHDRGAYTQGLQYLDGWIYEGTGNYGTSSIRLVDLETGEVTKVRNLDPSLFGEGITVLGDRIYQLTYKSQVGFIYDRTSFEEIQKVYYQNREGWGLTHNGRELIMSDGTHIIYFLDPELFTVIRQIEVYTDQGPLQSLNELEYIGGKIWANRYYTDEIVIIDPGTGKVEGRVNLKGILKTTDRRTTTDVLNGIAWDEQGDRVFVTGKNWPKLFEIRLRPAGSG
jgi:glutamine cyclotransferase